MFLSNYSFCRVQQTRTSRSSVSQCVFPGKPLDKPFYDLKRQFEKSPAVAKLDRVTLHVLKLTCAAHFIRSGVDLATVKEIMHHKSIEMTLLTCGMLTSHQST